MKQVIVIHGGRTFNTHKEYINSLKNREVGIERFKYQKDWKESLQKELGSKFEVFLPKMPNSFNARYQEWKIWFERMSKFLRNDAIFAGHSLGGIFLAKYFSENIFPKKVKVVILVSAPYDSSLNEALAEFKLSQNFDKFTEQTKNIYLIHSKDDPVVPFSHVNKYKKALPNASIVIFTDRQHFNQESFPEIVELIKSI